VEVLHLSGGTKRGTSLIPPLISVGFEHENRCSEGSGDSGGSGGSGGCLWIFCQGENQPFVFFTYFCIGIG
jgi:hypothetical protein